MFLVVLDQKFQLGTVFTVPKSSLSNTLKILLKNTIWNSFNHFQKLETLFFENLKSEILN